MKVLYLHQHFATRDGSGGTRSYEFARLLQRKGHEVTVICGRIDRSGLPPYAGGLVERREVEGIRIIQLNIFYSQKMGYVRRLVAFAWFVVLSSWIAVRERDSDVIFATSTPLTIAIPAIVSSRVNRIPFVFEVRDLWPDIPIGLGILRSPFLIACARNLERLAYRYATHIVALSPGMREGILGKGTEAEKVSVIPNACDNDLFEVPAEFGAGFRRRHSYLTDRPLVLYAGAFGMANGLDYLVRLARQVRYLDDHVAFLLVGVGREKEALLELAKDLGVLDKNLWFMDALSRQSTPEIFSAATIATSTFIPNPVLWNNSANKFFDSLAAGRPIAINHGGWQADLLSETGAGIVLPPGDLEKAAEMLVSFVHSEPRLKQAREAARVLARGRFDRNRLADQLEDILRNAAAAGIP